MFPTSILQGTYNTTSSPGNGGGNGGGGFSSASITSTTSFGSSSNEVYSGLAVNGNEIYLFNGFTGTTNPYPRYSNDRGSTWSTSISWDAVPEVTYNQDSTYDSASGYWVAVTGTNSATNSVLEVSTDPQNNNWASISTQSTGFFRTFRKINNNYYTLSTATNGSYMGILRSTSLTGSYTSKASTTNPVISQGNQIGGSGNTIIASLKNGAVYRSSDDGVNFSALSSSPNILLSPTGDGQGNWIAGSGGSNVNEYYKSTDDGASWSAHTITSTGAANYSRIQFIAYINNFWVAANNMGDIISSPNPFSSTDWDLVGSFTSIDNLKQIDTNKIGVTGRESNSSFFKVITLS